MKAAPDDQLRLLDLQALDSTLDRLAHRRKTLPELAQIEEAETRQSRIGDDIVLVESDLEDEELEIMEKREAVQSRLGELRAEREQIATTIADAEQRRDAAFAEIVAENEKTAAQRAETVAGLSAELVALYEKIRASSGGVGAAALHQGRCEGCHLQLNTTDINRIREAPADEVLRCEECRRILVRTAESGL